jgi:putative ABC transport system permease protein
MGTLLQDVRYSWRMLAAHRGFSAVAIFTLALGIGASTALFSVIDAAILRPLPYPHPEQLVELLEQERKGADVSLYGPSLTNARAWQQERGVLSHVCVWRSWTPILVDTGEFERVEYRDLSEGCLGMYGAPPVIGRGIVIEDTRVGAPRVVLLGYRYWQTRFGGSRDVIGRSVRLPDGPAAVVGVVPAHFGLGTGLFRSLQFRTPPEETLNGRGTTTEARLRPGVTLEQAAAALSSPVSVQVRSLYEETTRGYGRTLRTLGAAVVLILLLGCVNVAGLLLARGTARQTELAVRASIGASRPRLIRQLLTESLMLSLVAGALGVLLAALSLDALVALVPLSLPDDAPATLNGVVLTFAAAAAGASALVFGLVPALRLSGHAVGARLARGGRGHGSALSRRNAQFLIAAEVALAMVLLAGAGVMVRSFARLVSVDLGFDADDVYSMEVVPADPRPEVLATYYPELVRRVREVPPVAYVGAADELPLIGGASYSMVSAGAGPRTQVERSVIVPGYFEALGIPLLAGRLPSRQDGDSARHVAVISQDAATKLFGDASPLGRQIRFSKQEDYEVIGVVGAVRHWGAQWTRDAPKVYMLFGKESAGEASLVIRLRPGGVLPIEQLRNAATTIGPRVFVEQFRPASAWISKNTMRTRHRTQLFALLGGFGVLLALAGIFSMTAYAVANRTREIGVRMALGARADQVVATVLRDAAWPIALGTLAGLGGALLSTKVIASFLYNTSPNDPLTLALVAGTLAIAGVLAAWVPARHAARVDPLIALRAE